MCNGVKGTLTFVHWNAWCTGSQGPPDLGYGPPVATVWLPWAGKAIAGGLPPTALAQDMMSYMSYQISGRWRVQCYVTIYVMYWWYKSSCNPILGSPFASLVARDLSTPFSQLSHRNPLSRALPGTPEVSKINYLGLSYLCITVSQLVSLTTGQHFSGIRLESAGRLVVFVYLIACRNFASKVEQEPLSFGGAGCARPI